jgi:hypothetical protein
MARGGRQRRLNPRGNAQLVASLPPTNLFILSYSMNKVLSQRFLWVGHCQATVAQSLSRIHVGRVKLDVPTGMSFFAKYPPPAGIDLSR